MAKESKATGKDFAQGCLEVCPGLVIDTKIKMGAVWYLEDKYDKPINQIQFNQTGTDGNPIVRIRDLANIIIALSMQHNPELTEDQAIGLFKQCSPEQVQKAAEAISDIFSVSGKNSQGGAGLILEEKPKD